MDPTHCSASNEAVLFASSVLNQSSLLSNSRTLFYFLNLKFKEDKKNSYCKDKHGYHLAFHDDCDEDREIECYLNYPICFGIKLYCVPLDNVKTVIEFVVQNPLRSQLAL